MDYLKKENIPPQIIFSNYLQAHTGGKNNKTINVKPQGGSGDGMLSE